MEPKREQVMLKLRLSKVWDKKMKEIASIKDIEERNIAYKTLIEVLDAFEAILNRGNYEHRIRKQV